MGIEFYNKYREFGYSQHGEEGVIQEIVRRINPVKVSCEFGAQDGKKYSNTFRLLEQGWRGIFIEENEAYAPLLFENISGKNAVAYITEITIENINEMITQELGLLSIDVDNDDYHLWAAHSGKVDIVCIEIHSGILPPKEEIPGKSGASYSSMLKLAKKKGYFLICHTGNMIFALNKYKSLFPECMGDGTNWEYYWDKDLK